MRIVNRLINHFKGNYRLAIENGLTVGEGVSLVGGGKSINFGSEPYLITLGNHCRISTEVFFVTHDGGTWAFRDQEKYKDIIKYGRISVGEHTFIGTRSIIMPGVTIGRRCVIGAGSVVTNDIPDNSVAVGVPAKVIMTTEEYAERCLNRQKPYCRAEYEKDKRSFLTEWLKEKR